MHKEVAGFGDISNAALIKTADFNETVGMEGHYVAKCYDKDGNLKSTTFMAFEDQKELTYFMLACPHLRRN